MPNICRFNGKFKTSDKSGKLVAVIQKHQISFKLRKMSSIMKFLKQKKSRMNKPGLFQHYYFFELLFRINVIQVFIQWGHIWHQ